MTQGIDKEHVPDELTLEIGDGSTRRINLVGPSIWGHVYREKSGSYFYRIIPIDDIRDAEKRDITHRQIGKPRRRLVAPIIDAAQWKGYYYIRYEIKPDTTWGEVISDTNPTIRLEYAVQVLRALPYWWDAIHEGFLPMPQDIVFLGRDPFLLAIPVFLGYPGIESLFSVPERILYLAPEIIRGRESQIRGKNLDVYGSGAALLQCLYTFNFQKKADSLLTKVATGNLFPRESMEKRLPLWVDKVEPVREIYSHVYKAVDPDIRIRSKVDPVSLARAIEKNIQYLEPKTAVNKLQKAGESEKAFSLLQDIFLSNATAELLLTAGMMAKDELNRPLEAIRYFERAISKDPGESRAYGQQLELLLRKEILTLLALQIEKRFTISEKLDNMVWRDFFGIPVQDQKRFAVDCARYFNWRKSYGKAAKLLYNFLFDGKTFLWWEFPRTLTYAESLIGMKRYEEAGRFLRDIKEKLLRVRGEKRMEPGEIHKYGKELSRLETMLFEITHKKGH